MLHQAWTLLCDILRDSEQKNKRQGACANAGSGSSMKMALDKLTERPGARRESKLANQAKFIKIYSTWANKLPIWGKDMDDTLRDLQDLQAMAQNQPGMLTTGIEQKITAKKELLAAKMARQEAGFDSQGLKLNGLIQGLGRFALGGNDKSPWGMYNTALRLSPSLLTFAILAKLYF